MTKHELILQYFHKPDQLNVLNKAYFHTLSSLFTWLTGNDSKGNDITTKSLGIDFPATASITAKEKGVISGLEEIGYLLKEHTRLKFNPKIKDGRTVEKNRNIAEISGNTMEILAYERTILNILQRMSGIATKTNHLVNLINLQLTTNNPQLLISATRKTPWMGLDKKAVAVGGGLTHRLSLSDLILVKDNHLLAVRKKYKLKNNLEAIKKSVELIYSGKKNVMAEIEVEKEQEAEFALIAFQPFNHSNHLTIMLDNFTPNSAELTIDRLKNKFDLSEIIFEASGGINEKNIGEWAKTGVDLISLGSLTHSARSLNLSMEF